jgi:hypothetical protein
MCGRGTPGRAATRSEKTARNYRSVVTLAAIVCGYNKRPPNLAGGSGHAKLGGEAEAGKISNAAEEAPTTTCL